MDRLAQRVAAARRHEAEGDPAAAAREYAAAGRMGEVDRVLSAAGRHGDAATLMLQTLGVSPDEVGTLTGQASKVARRALELFEAAGDTRTAERMHKAFAKGAPAAAGWRHVGAGSAEHLKTIADLEAAGRFAAAARVAWDAKLYPQALRYFEQQESHYEAGMILSEAGRPKRALAHLLAVPTSHKRYRAAAVQALEIALELGRFEFDVDKMVSPLVATPPRSKREVLAYVALARAYADRGFRAGAAQVLQRVLEHDSEHEVARALLAEVAPQKAAQLASQISGDLALPDLDSFVVRKQASSPGRSGTPSKPPSKPPAAASAPSKPPAASAPSPAASAPSEPPAASAPSKPPAASAPSPAASAPAPGSVRSRVVTSAETLAPEPADAGDATPRMSQGPPIPVHLPAGRLLANRYEVVRELGEGGMASVYQVHDHVVDRHIALKILHRSANPELWASRFRRELALARDLNHRNIVRVFDIGEDKGDVFMTMELLEGTSLAELPMPMSLSAVLGHMVQACAGLGAAHTAGIVHRDVKPANLFVTTSGRVKVMDFGIAKAKGEKGRTAHGVMVGTPEYAAPEQCVDAANVTFKADMYSFGICLYEMLTGAPPFDHEHIWAVLRAHAEDLPRAMTTLVPSLPKAMDDLVLRLLAKNPADRPADMAEVASALRAVAREYR